MGFNIRFACISHTGRRRSMNQDNFICNGQHMEIQKDNLTVPLTGCVSAKDAAVFGVFDGLGGEEHGEIASYIAAKDAASITIGKDVKVDLLNFCMDANRKIVKYTFENQISLMATTAAMLVFTEEGIGICNIGDSKIYRMVKGQMWQMSMDHVAPVVSAKKPPLTQSLGIDPSKRMIEPYVAWGKYCKDDIYLICSDGLTDMVPQEEIAEILMKGQSDKAVCKLLDKALNNGGRDNITIIVCKVERKGLFQK